MFKIRLIDPKCKGCPLLIIKEVMNEEFCFCAADVTNECINSDSVYLEFSDDKAIKIVENLIEQQLCDEFDTVVDEDFKIVREKVLKYLEYLEIWELKRVKEIIKNQVWLLWN